MLVTQNRFRAPQRMAFGNLHDFSSKHDANLEKTTPTTPMTPTEIRLEEMTKKYKHERGLKRAAMLGGLLSGVVIFVNQNITNNKIEALEKRQAQTTALLSEATYGDINAKNLDKAIAARQADSLAEATKKAFEAARITADSLKKSLIK